MRCYVEFISVPTADTPGTLLYLHYDQKRYLIGRLSEGSTRTCTERGVGLRKVSDIILTGKTEWSNVGGLLGMMLALADTKTAALTSKETTKEDLEDNAQDSGATRQKQEKPQLNIFGPPNLNHLFATSRRFIFRSGLPVNVREFGASDTAGEEDHKLEPTWQDENILVWALAILPDQGSKRQPGSSRKRSYTESDEDRDLDSTRAAGTPSADELRKSIVKQMFDSSWRYDRLVSQPLSDLDPSTPCFTRDPVTNRLSKYSGPMPGGDGPVPNIKVLAREPWPGAATRHIPPTRPAREALSYIIKNHPQRGKFLPERADQLGVPKSSRRCLTHGLSVTNQDGEQITPEMVLEPGKPGGGFAIIDVPDVAYLEPILERPEWESKRIMTGVEVMVWILGPGLIHDARLQRFQSDRPHMKHLISSPDCCANSFALESAAENAFRHNIVDDKIFPTLMWNDAAEGLSQGQVARPGQKIVLAPKLDYEDDSISPTFHPQKLRAKLLVQITSNDAVAAALDSGTGSLKDMKSSLKPYGDVEIIVLGTGSSHPGKYRNVSGTLVRVPGWGYCLFDAGEGTLNTLRRMFSEPDLRNILGDLKMIWVSHMHADHHLGLTSIIKAWGEATSKSNPQKELAVVSDTAMLLWLHEYSSMEELDISRILMVATKPLRGQSLHKKNIQLLEKQPTAVTLVDSRSSMQTSSNATTEMILDQLGVDSLNTVYVRHCRGAQAISILFKSGFKISYSGDCRPSSEFTLIGRGSHVLIHEATLEDDMRVEAIAKKHSTAGEALVVASNMQAHVCLLTHFSQRYPKMPPLGVKIDTNSPQARVQRLSGVLEETGGPSSVTADVETGEQASNHSAADLDQGTNTSAENPIQPHGIQLIDERDLQSLIESNQLSVVFAFDYMRLELKDVPRLEAKQHILRQILTLQTAKDEALDARAENLGNTDERPKSRSGEKKREGKSVKSGGSGLPKLASPRARKSDQPTNLHGAVAFDAT